MPDRDLKARLERWCERCGARLRRGNATTTCGPCELRAAASRAILIEAARRPCVVCGTDTGSRTRAYCDTCRPNARLKSRPKRHETPPLCACGEPRATFRRSYGTGYRTTCNHCRTDRLRQEPSATTPPPRAYPSKVKDTAA